jgi:hypothetical protein
VLRITRAASAERLTLREVALRFAAPRGNVVGTPEQIADKFEAWLDSSTSDGFVISEALPGQFQRLVEAVVPILQKRGSFRERSTRAAPFARTSGWSSRSTATPAPAPRRSPGARVAPLLALRLQRPRSAWREPSPRPSVVDHPELPEHAPAQRDEPERRARRGNSTCTSAESRPCSSTAKRSVSSTASSTSCVTSSTAGRWRRHSSATRLVHADAC